MHDLLLRHAAYLLVHESYLLTWRQMFPSKIKKSNGIDPASVNAAAAAALFSAAWQQGPPQPPPSAITIHCCTPVFCTPRSLSEPAIIAVSQQSSPHHPTSAAAATDLQGVGSRCPPIVR